MNAPTTPPSIDVKELANRLSELDAEIGAAPSHPAWRGGVEVGGATLRGSYHPDNEDSCLYLEGGGPSKLAVVDGVGSGAFGKVASASMIDQIQLLTPRLLGNLTALRDWLLASDEAVSAAIRELTQRPGAATFVAAVPTLGMRRWGLTWAGDCRAYRITANGALQCLTLDDTYRNLGEDPPEGSNVDDPARMVGNGAVDKANWNGTRLSCGEILILLSDGVHRFVPEEQIVQLMRKPGSLKQRCHNLCKAAHANGGTDDATAVALERFRWFGLGESVWCLAALCIAAIVAMQLYR